MLARQEIDYYDDKRMYTFVIMWFRGDFVVGRREQTRSKNKSNRSFAEESSHENKFVVMVTARWHNGQHSVAELLLR